MKKIVLKYGLISGAISGALMLATVPFIYRIGFDYGAFVGYSAMLLSFLLVFFGIRAYRESVLDGQIGFFRAVGVGLLITLISNLCYVITWEIVYFTLLPDFPEKYAAFLVEKMQRSGESAATIAAKVEEIKGMKAILDNPLWNGLIAFIEPLPVGIPVTLISALILRKKPKQTEEENLVATT